MKAMYFLILRIFGGRSSVPCETFHSSSDPPQCFHMASTSVSKLCPLAKVLGICDLPCENSSKGVKKAAAIPQNTTFLHVKKYFGGFPLWLSGNESD